MVTATPNTPNLLSATFARPGPRRSLRSRSPTPKKHIRAIANLIPSLILRYSAKHKNLYNGLYKFGPVQAYRKGNASKTAKETPPSSPKTTTAILPTASSMSNSKEATSKLDLKFQQQQKQFIECVPLRPQRRMGRSHPMQNPRQICTAMPPSNRRQKKLPLLHRQRSCALPRPRRPKGLGKFARWFDRSLRSLPSQKEYSNLIPHHQPQSPTNGYFAKALQEETPKTEDGNTIRTKKRLPTDHETQSNNCIRLQQNP